MNTMAAEKASIRRGFSSDRMFMGSGFFAGAKPRNDGEVPHRIGTAIAEGPPPALGCRP
jgi:hypothetical protein